MFPFFNRIKALRAMSFENGGKLLFSKNVRFYLEPNSQIIVTGGVSTLGYAFHGKTPRPSLDKTVISLKRGARLVIGPNVHICPGTYIHVGEHAEVIFHGQNLISYNCSFLCTRKIEIFENVSISWNVSLIDCDGRDFFDTEGNVIPQIPRNLIIKKNSGLQMNVVVPKGVVIGENAIIGANTVLRQDVPDGCLVYQNPELRIRKNTTLGWQYES